MLRAVLWRGPLAVSVSLLALGGAPLMAQEVVQAVPVVQPVRGPAPGVRELNGALSRLAVNSRDIDALVDAGNAALLIGDKDAASGFFARAQQVDPRNFRVLVGLGSAKLKQEDPYEALRLFDEAVKSGAPVSLVAADRGLAYDMVGDTTSAQRDYQLAMSYAPDNELLRRYAMSLAISGNRAEAEKRLAPLLAQQDPAANRMRAFIYAVDGREDEAVAIAYASMPQRIAEGVSPFLRFMPRLTPAQQAAAAHFGHFPRAADIGRDDPRAAAYASATPTRRGSGRADAGLVPAGEPLGSGSSARRRDDEPRPSRAARRRPGAPEISTGRELAGGRRPRTEEAPSRPSTRRQTVEVAAAPPAPKPVVAAPAAAPVRTAAVTPPPAASVAAETSYTVTSMTSLPAPPVPATPAQVAAVKPGTSYAVTDLASLPAPGAPVPQAGVTATTVVTPPASPPVVQAAAVVAAPQPELPPVAVQPVPAPATILPAAVTTPAPQPAAPAPTPGFVSLGDTPTATPTIAASGFDLATMPGTPIAVAATAPVVATPPAATPVPTVQPVPDFRGAFADLTVPKDELAPAAEAVDLRTITPTRPKPPEPKAVDPKPVVTADAKPGKPTTVRRGAAAPKADEKPAKPKHAARHWVQLATGADAKALSYDYRRFVTKAPEAFKGKSGHTVPFRRTNRLLVGPFVSAKEAQAFVTLISKKDIISTTFASEDGQEIFPLGK